ncbi:MAG: site-specific tyrosine recombinase XerD [Anaerolineae bacterium]
MESQIQSFLEFLSVEKGYARNTLSAYQTDLNQFAGYLTERDRSLAYGEGWGRVGKDDILSYILHLKHERGYASATVARKVAAIKSHFHFLWRDGVIAEDPTATLESPRVEKRLPRAISQSAVRKLLAEPAKGETPKAARDSALLELAYATGMRASEIVSLDLDDVNLPSGSIRCFGKGSKERIIPIYPRAAEALRRYLEHARRGFLKNPSERALFLNQRGRRLTRQGLWLIIKGYAEDAGLPDTVTPHTLRHSFATHMLDGDADLINVQQLLGHANVSTTQVYTQVTTERLHEAFEKAHPRARVEEAASGGGPPSREKANLGG